MGEHPGLELVAEIDDSRHATSMTVLHPSPSAPRRGYFLAHSDPAFGDTRRRTGIGAAAPLGTGPLPLRGASCHASLSRRWQPSEQGIVHDVVELARSEEQRGAADLGVELAVVEVGEVAMVHFVSTDPASPFTAIDHSHAPRRRIDTATSRDIPIGVRRESRRAGRLVRRARWPFDSGRLKEWRRHERLDRPRPLHG